MASYDFSLSNSLLCMFLSEGHCLLLTNENDTRSCGNNDASYWTALPNRISVRCLVHKWSTSKGCLASFLPSSAALVSENLLTVSVSSRITWKIDLFLQCENRNYRWGFWKHWNYLFLNLIPASSLTEIQELESFMQCCLYSLKAVWFEASFNICKVQICP